MNVLKIMLASSCRHGDGLSCKQISVQKGERLLKPILLLKSCLQLCRCFLNLRIFFSVGCCSQTVVPRSLFLQSMPLVQAVPCQLLDPAALFLSFLLLPHMVLPWLFSHIMDVPGKLIQLKNNTVFFTPLPAQSAVFLLDKFLDLVSCNAVQRALPGASGMDSGQRLLGLTKAALLPK